MQPASTILVVDDNDMNRDVLTRRLVKDGYEVESVENGKQALEILQNQLFDIVLLDIMMPEMNGYEVLQRMKEDNALRSIPVIMISAIDELDSVVKCIELGAEDYLTKPFNPVLLHARVTACLEKKHFHDKEVYYQKQLKEYNSELEERVREQVREITSAQLSTIFATSKLAESKDPETGEHLDRMREYCRILADCLSMNSEYRDYIDAEYIDMIYAASPLHDIGKVGIPDSILLKPGKLTEEEWVIMKTHTTIGADTLRAVNEKHPGNMMIEMGIAIAEGHHEKWNGSGYPSGKAGLDIPLSARILSLADVYDALTSVRCYKKAFSHEQSKQIILEDSGKHFDPAIVEAFLKAEQEFILIKDKYRDE